MTAREPLRILLVEDSPDDAELIVRELRRGGHDVAARRVEDAPSMGAELAAQTWDLVIADHSMPRFDSFGALELLRSAGLDVPFIIVSGAIGEDAAVAAMKAGAHDYLLKGNLARLSAAVERELGDAVERRSRRRAEAELQQALLDPVTDLPGRSLFRDRLTQALLTAEREQYRLLVVLMDLDNFKEVNDTFGHLAGDRLLREIGSRFRRTLRHSDSVARLGGDEFGVLLPKLEAPEAPDELVQKLLSVFETPFRVEGIDLAVRASMGIAHYPDHGSDVEELLRHADVAMYAAKRRGIRYATYRPEEDHYSRARISLMSDLRGAASRGELALHYQPVIDLRRRSVLGMEALLRWRHPVHGNVSPSDFIPVAERIGAIKEMTAWVLTEALRRCHVWQEQGSGDAVMVNVSSVNLADAEFPRVVAAALERSGVPASALYLEITETAILVEPERAARAIDVLRRQGVRFAIDDFGTGYSSLGHLRRLDVSLLKIDKSFINTMREDEHSAAIVRATIDLGHRLGLRVVAEGIEDPATLRILARAGCDLAQGYVFGQPDPAPDGAFVRHALAPLRPTLWERLWADRRASDPI